MGLTAGTDSNTATTPAVPPAFAPWISDEAVDRFAAIATAVAPDGDDVAACRRHYDRLNTARLGIAHSRYDVTARRTEIAGVPAHDVRAAVAKQDESVLLCLHGGAFMWGDGAGALLEAVPVAAVSGMRVLAIEYRLAPEHRYPCAVDDVLAVIRDLRAHAPDIRIGIYGCSAGAVLTAQVVARLVAAGDPPVAAIAMLHAAGIEVGGDTLELAAMTNGTQDAAAVRRLHDLSYFTGTDPLDPMVFPGEHPGILSAFPPSLLISGTRDFAGSSVAVMHRRLRAAGVPADFVLFDGMWHAHHVDTDLPESAEVFALLAAFFRRHMA